VTEATPSPTPTARVAVPKKHSLTGLTGTSQEKQLALQLFNVINQDRVANGLKALSVNRPSPSAHASTASRCRVPVVCNISALAKAIPAPV